MTLEADIANVEAHNRLLELSKTINPKVAKIQADRDVKVARAKSMTDETRMFRNAAVVVVFAIAFCSACSAYVWGGPENVQLEIEKQRMTQERYSQCIDAGGDWDSQQNDCDLED